MFRGFRILGLRFCMNSGFRFEVGFVAPVSRQPPVPTRFKLAVLVILLLDWVYE